MGGRGSTRVSGEDTYQFTHGNSPRGQGTWGFNVGGKTVFVRGSYSGAKRTIAKYAKARGIFNVKVLT
jgi:hypothetical protein